MFRCASSSDTRRLTVASGVPSLREAADRLPASTTASNVVIASSRSMLELSILRKGGFHSYSIILSGRMVHLSVYTCICADVDARKGWP